MFNSQYLPTDIDFDARMDEPYPQYEPHVVAVADIASWVLPPRQREFDAATVLATMRRETPRLRWVRDVNDIVALIVACRQKKASE